MQSYAILDARTPGIVNIISNKDCKEWRIDALRKSKCVCALFVLTEKEFEMKKKIGTVIVACIVMSCVLIGCQETNGDEGNVNSTLDQQRQDTTDSNINVEQEESGIEEFLNITYNELVATEKTLTLSYYEGGGSPVYAVEEYEGVYIVYPAVSDEPQMNNLAESISDEIPVKLVIRNSETEIHPGLRVGMPAEKVNNLNIAWDDIYMSSENSLYYTSFKRDENEVTAAWAIPDDMFSEWSASLNDEDDYYAKFLEFIQPFKSEPVGTIVELSVKKVEAEVIQNGWDTDDGKWMGYNEQFGLTLTLPEHWAEIAVVDATNNTEDSDFAHVFTLREKIAYNELNKGVVWTLLACPVNVELEYMIEGAVTTDGLYLIGSDSKFHYLLTYREDTYYSDLNSEIARTGKEQYYQLQKESKAVLSAFLRENGIEVNPICPANRCYEIESVQLTQQIENEYFGLILTIPEHWNEIAVISAESKKSPASREAGPVSAFTLYEKIAYTASIQAGYVWYLQAYPIGTEFEYNINGVETVNGRCVLGTDDNHIYLIGFPTGVEYLMDNTDVRKLTESQIRYRQLQEETRAVLTNFLEENGITANEYYSIQDIKFQG